VILIFDLTLSFVEYSKWYMGYIGTIVISARHEQNLPSSACISLVAGFLLSEVIMATQQRRHYCKTCGQSRLFTKQSVNHVLHLILSVLTGGVWVVIWILAGLASLLTPFRCTDCGKGKM